MQRRPIRCPWNDTGARQAILQFVEAVTGAERSLEQAEAQG